MERVLICGVNWIGDAIMSMPAIQSFRQLHPDIHISLLVKPPLVPLWEMHRAPDRIISLHSGLGGTWNTARAVRREAFDTAFVLPHSFRSALIPRLAGVPRRIGMPGHARDGMLTEVIDPHADGRERHQSYEYKALLCPEKEPPLPAPALEISDEKTRIATARLAAIPRPWVALMPGAARGPSKQWPENHFIRLGQQLTAEAHCGVVLCGSPAERDLCEHIVTRIGGQAISVAGKTDIPAWAQTLHACDASVANDSGGMHLSAAVGTPVVALYGVTNPAQTGPLGRGCRVLQHSAKKARDIAEDSPAGREALAAIQPAEVYRAVLETLKKEEES